MSYDVCNDIATYLEEQDLGQVGVDIFTFEKYRKMGELDGILIEAPTPGEIPDVLIQTETVPIDITISKGYGEQGREYTANLAHRVFMALDLVNEVTINGTLYLCITAETNPYELERDGRYFRMIRFSVTRYYGDIQTNLLDD